MRNSSISEVTTKCRRAACFRALALLLAAVFSTGCGRDESAGGKALKGHDHSAASPAQKAEAPASELSYTCPMHPSVNSPDPGQCPICGMNLVAVTRGNEGAEVAIDPERARRAGIASSPAERSAVAAETRTVGRVMYDETRLADVTLKYGGFVERLEVDTIGQQVRKGQVLFTLYSPELFAAQQELIAARASRRSAPDADATRRAGYLLEAARQRLKLWDLTDGQIEGIAAAGVPLREVPILSGVEGYVIEKNVVAGASVEAGARLFRVADLSTVWVEADVFEGDVASIRVGDPARIIVPYLGGRSIDGTVDFVYPWLEGSTRTARARIRVENRDLALKPDMFADVVFRVELGVQTLVPDTAVLYAGDKRYVFVEVSPGHFRPRAVTLGQRVGERIVVTDGLTAGEHVVTSGNFLVAAESRLKVALEDWQ